MMKNISVCCCFFLLATGAAFADQAAWIDKVSADKAAAMIASAKVLREFCAPCGDKMWTEVKADKVEIKSRGESNYEVEVNGKGMDLAYTYVPQKGRWMNLALLLGLEVSDVSRILPEENPADAQVVGTEDAEHPIDRILGDCVAGNDTTAGMTECASQAYDLWDAELNKVYNQLKVNLKPEQRKALNAAQLEWLKYRDKEFALTDGIYGSLDGSMYGPMRVEERLSIVRDRTLRLGSYLEILKGR